MVLDGWEHLPVGHLGVVMCMCDSEGGRGWEHLPVGDLGVGMCRCNSDGARWMGTPPCGRSWGGDVQVQF